MAQSMNQVATKYAVKLSIIANSFYDPFSKANLFRDTPYYLFNHEPTAAIINGVKGGRLIDIKGNIPTGLLTEVASTIAPIDTVYIDAMRESIRKEIESEMKAELAAAQADAEEKANKSKAKKPAKEDSEK